MPDFIKQQRQVGLFLIQNMSRRSSLIPSIDRQEFKGLRNLRSGNLDALGVQQPIRADCHLRRAFGIRVVGPACKSTAEWFF